MRRARWDSACPWRAVTCAPWVLHGCGPAQWNFETAEGPKSIHVDGPLCTNNVVIIRDAILAGVGVGWLPDYVVGEELRDGRLVRLLPEAKLPPIRVFGIMPKQARQTAAGRGGAARTTAACAPGCSRGRPLRLEGASTRVDRRPRTGVGVFPPASHQNGRHCTCAL